MARHENPISVPRLNKQINPYVLKASPTVLSLGSLIMDDACDFHWVHGEEPYIVTPSKKSIWLDVVNKTPVLPVLPGTPTQSDDSDIEHDVAYETDFEFSSADEARSSRQNPVGPGEQSPKLSARGAIAAAGAALQHGTNHPTDSAAAHSLRPQAYHTVSQHPNAMDCLDSHRTAGPHLPAEKDARSEHSHPPHLLLRTLVTDVSTALPIQEGGSSSSGSN